MAVTILDQSGAQGANSSGGLDALTATWDYDSTAQTVGLTVSGQGSAFVATLTDSKGSWTVDAKKGAQGNIVGAGRQVILGSGSIIHQNQKVTAIPSGVVVTWAWAST